MKPEELMLGDWISFNGEIVKVQQVVGGINEIDYDPIPLTAEILEKNDFHLIGTIWHWRGYTYDVCIEFTDKVAVRIFNELKPKDKKGRQDLVSYNRDWAQPFFVHELQHALKDCGIDKQIIL